MMDLPVDLWLLALALSMDACAAALALGAGAAGRGIARLAGATGLLFGAAQGAMPLLGALAADLAGDRLAAVDHWVAFAILAFLGVSMLRAAGKAGEADRERAAAHLPALALATSIDAAAAGVTLPLFPVPVLLSAAVIGGTTALLSGLAVGLGALAGARLGRVAEALGGLLLIGIGARILASHLSEGL
jgi:putative Mn2+ efflux pump MntP